MASMVTARGLSADLPGSGPIPLHLLERGGPDAVWVRIYAICRHVLHAAGEDLSASRRFLHSLRPVPCLRDAATVRMAVGPPCGGSSYGCGS